ncbi:MAG: YeeE/YedE thiosulfate transporter family protein [Pseudomonadota bacterium]
MTTDFTPLVSTVGGALIGLSAVLLMLFLGRIMGATGILAGIVAPTSRNEVAWRVAVLFGMITGPMAMLTVTGSFPAIQVPGSTSMLAIGGVIVGIGVTLGGGCTSGHGVCGMARLSPRSLVATVTFMIATAATVFLLRHVVGAY